jgi:hypothetical protein
VDLFRVSRNAWGQETLVGVSWDLLWVFIAAAALFIVCHMVYKAFLAPDRGQKHRP